MGISSIWREVITAIEETREHYDRVNRYVSFGLDRIARTYAARRARIHGHSRILDLGIGPGTMTETLLTNTRNLRLVGLDYSAPLLRRTRRRFHGRGHLHLVRGAFETLPFKDNLFDAVFMAYALRDSIDMTKTLDQVKRVCNKEEGRLAVVDIGKPGNPLRRLLTSIYLLFAMPLIAKILTVRKVVGSPWSMIIPTYQALPTSEEIARMLSRRFEHLESRSYLLGGIVVFVARTPV
ncbi:MAG: class I SAM-dependent methyltransferase [Candidatus Geothermarchaeales archaeon]